MDRQSTRYFSGTPTDTVIIVTACLDQDRYFYHYFCRHIFIYNGKCDGKCNCQKNIPAVDFRFAFKAHSILEVSDLKTKSTKIWNRKSFTELTVLIATSFMLVKLKDSEAWE